jgi:hypothetical protein
MKKNRAPDLTAERISRIVDLLDGWEGKLTWDALIERVKDEIGIRYSRFTLGEYRRIADAFGVRKQALRSEPSGPALPRDKRLRAAVEQADRYRQKALRLDRENQVLLEQFVTWATNAEKAGVSIAMLNKPIPKPSRDRTRGESDTSGDASAQR